MRLYKLLNNFHFSNSLPFRIGNRVVSYATHRIEQNSSGDKLSLIISDINDLQNSKDDIGPKKLCSILQSIIKTDIDASTFVFNQILNRSNEYDPDLEVFTFYAIHIFKVKTAEDALKSIIYLLKATCVKKVPSFFLELCIFNALEAKSMLLMDLFDILAMEVTTDYIDDIVQQILVPNLQWDRIGKIVKAHILSFDSYLAIIDTILQQHSSLYVGETGAIVHRYDLLKKTIETWIQRYNIDIYQNNDLLRAIEYACVHLFYPPTRDFLKFIQDLKNKLI